MDQITLDLENEGQPIFENKHFDMCAEFTLDIEQEYYNHPDDKGGPTMRGVAWNYNKTWYAMFGITRPEDVHLLTHDQARYIYYKKYYIGGKCEKLEDYPKTLMAYFDHVIHGGIIGAGEVLQLSINKLTLGTVDDIVVDGIVGKNTLKALDDLLAGGYNPDENFSDENFALTVCNTRGDKYEDHYNNENHGWYGLTRFLNSGKRRVAMFLKDKL